MSLILRWDASGPFCDDVNRFDRYRWCFQIGFIATKDRKHHVHAIIKLTKEAVYTIQPGRLLFGIFSDNLVRFNQDSTGVFRVRISKQ
jgi:hypothetical protein